MGRELEVGLKLTARRDSSLQRNLKQTTGGLEEIGAAARKSAGLTKAAADTQARAVERAERKTNGLARTWQRSARTVAGWGRAVRKAAADADIQRKSVAALNKGLDSVANKYTGLVSAVGAGMTIRNVGNAQERLERLGIQAGFSSDKMKALKKDIYAAALDGDVRVDPKEILAGVESIVEKTGNLEFAEQNLRNIGVAMQATGATGINIGELFGEFEKMGIKGPQKVAEALDILNVQGKSGAFTLQNLAALGPRVITAYTATGREGTTALREMGAALQMIRMGTGSSEMAATAFEATLRTLTDPKKIKQLEEMGLTLFDPEAAAQGKRVMRPINELMAEIVEITAGDKVEMGQIFDAEAVRAFNQAAGEFQRTGKLEKLDEFYNVQATGQTTLEDSQRAAKNFNASISMIAASWERFAEKKLTGPIESMAKLIDMLGSDGADRLFSGLAVGGGLLGGALAVRKGVGLYKGVKGFFGKGKKGGPGGGLAGALMGGGEVMNVRVVNWPAARALRGMDDFGGFDMETGRSRGRGRKSSGLAGKSKGLGRLAKGGKWLRRGGRLLGKAGGPLAALAGIADLGMAISSGSNREIGGSLGRSGGGLAGAMAGAAAGSVVPVVGTAIGGILGGMFGSWLGGKAGESAGTAMEKPSGATGAAAGAGGIGAVTINVQAAPGMDVEALAQTVMKKIERMRSGRLYD